MLPQELIRRKRDGATLEPDEIAAFVQGLCDGSMTDAQVAAFAMAVYFRGMQSEECRHLTRAMTSSGLRLDWAPWDLRGPIIDKHSTGGVGDKVSLVLAPLLAACGGVVPMIAGRGLGHTGGTIDKLESIPGYDTAIGVERMGRILRDVGCAIVGQSEALAPADRRLYGIRDVTATVESIPLITASILSKKLAAGLHHLVIDLKVGNGAFARDMATARALGRSLVDVATGAGLPTVAYLTDMNEVLGTTAGNALEVRESIHFLSGEAQDERLLELTLTLATELLTMAGLAGDATEARQRAASALRRGDALETFARMVHAMGGPGDLVDSPEQLAGAPVVLDVHAPHPGYVHAIDTRALGLVVLELGGGRRRTSDAVDPRVGLDGIAGLGAMVGPGGAPLCRVHARDEAQAHRAEQAVRAAMTCAEHRGPAPGPLVFERILPA